MNSLSDPLAVRITTPAPESVPGRGFYQLEESALYIQIGLQDRSRHYFSSLESQLVRLDIDRDARLMFIEVAAARNTWSVIDQLDLPVWAEPADVRFLGFRTSIPNPRLLTDKGRRRLQILFSPTPVAHAVSIAESVILTVDDRQSIVSIHITDITDDLAGREIAHFRKAFREDISNVPVA
jgi:hypothetical protein